MRIEGPEALLRELPEVIKTVFFRVAQESLTNMAKHSQAEQVDLALCFDEDPGELRMSITDNGCGFDTLAVHQNPSLGIGLRNMRERLEAIGGRLAISAAPGHGTQIQAIVPKAVLQKLAAV